MSNNQSDIIRPKNKAWAIQAFVDAHPQWRGVKRDLSALWHDGWEYIRFQGSDVGRVKIDGNSIIAESLWGYTKLDEKTNG